MSMSTFPWADNYSAVPNWPRPTHNLSLSFCVYPLTFSICGPQAVLCHMLHLNLWSYNLLATRLHGLCKIVFDYLSKSLQFQNLNKINVYVTFTTSSQDITVCQFLQLKIWLYCPQVALNKYSCDQHDGCDHKLLKYTLNNYSTLTAKHTSNEDFPLKIWTYRELFFKTWNSWEFKNT